GRRQELVTRFGFIGNAADIHGPFLGPDGRLYWTDGRHGHEIHQPDGRVLTGKAARVFRCRPDGRDVEVVCGGGMDDPVEVAFTPEGEAFATVDILHGRPQRVPPRLAGPARRPAGRTWRNLPRPPQGRPAGVRPARPETEMGRGLRR